MPDQCTLIPPNYRLIASSNAIKYSPQNKSIYLSNIVADQNIIISIKDEGIGIPLIDQEHLFTRFFRANNVTNIQGTGLGLNIVKQYVEMLGGEISFVSKHEVGSTFIVKIPNSI